MRGAGVMVQGAGLRVQDLGSRVLVQGVGGYRRATHGGAGRGGSDEGGQGRDEGHVNPPAGGVRSRVGHRHLEAVPMRARI